MNANGRWKENVGMLAAIVSIQLAISSVFGLAIMDTRDDQRSLLQGRIENTQRLTALESSTTEQETQHRCSAVVRNVEHQWQEIVSDLLQQCPTCRQMSRTYWPPGPGPNGHSIGTGTN